MKTYSDQELIAEAKKAGHNVSSVLDITPDMFKKLASGKQADLNLSILGAMKKQIQAGNLTVADYAKKVQPYAENITNTLKKWSKTDVSYAQKARAYGDELSKFADIGSRANGGYDYTFKDSKVPFTRTEYAQLNPTVLPTKNDVATGIISRDSMPFERFQGVDQQGAPTGALEGQSGIPTDINLGSDRGAIELEAQRQAGQLQTAADEQKRIRAEGRAQLAAKLTDYQNEQFNRAIPQLAEQANTRGILRSTGFGEQLAQKYSDLTKDTEMELARYDLGDNEKYASAIGDIANVRAGLQTGGLQREFSLQDAQRSEDLAKYLAQISQPSSSSGKTSGEKWAQGVTATGSLAQGAGALFGA